MRAAAVTSGPGYGLPQIGNLRKFRGSLERSYANFLATGEFDAAVRPVVAGSWRLSRDSGVSPERVLPPIEWADEELAAYRDAHPLAAIMPLIRQLLIEDAAGQGAVVAVLDADSRLLWVEGDAKLRDRAEAMHWVPGTCWSERLAGTNAPATSLRLDRPVQIFSREHFASNVEPWSCAAAPVHHPVTGELLGALDITGSDDVAAPIVLGLVRATVAAAESQLRLTALTRTLSAPTRPLRVRATPAALQVLGRTRALVTHRGRAVPLSLRHSEMLLLLDEDTAGYSAERLAVDLHDRDVAPVTVRAELSRLRHLLPELDLQARPYRLGTPLRSDIGEVREALAGSDLARAIDAFAGPVLPDSESPAVQRIRTDLQYRLRTALLASSDVDTVMRYARTVAGRNDRTVWEHLLTIVPRAGRRAVLDRLDALDVEFG